MPDSEEETDPVEIARHAGRRPSFPNLDAVSAAESETSGTTAEPAAVGVMDALASGDLADAWASWNEATAPADVTQSPAAPDGTASEDAAPVPQTTSLLQSVPISRPFADLGGERHEE